MRARAIPLILVAAAALAGCGVGSEGGGGADEPAEPRREAPVLGQPAQEEKAAEALGFPAFATKNTTRVGGADPIADAAGVARAVHPGGSGGTPAAVVLVDAGDWRSAISAAQLTARPTRFPVLLSDDGELPPATEEAVEALNPGGSKELGDVQVVRVGDAAPVKGLRPRAVQGSSPAAIAREVDRVATEAAGKASRAVIVAPSDGPGFAMPAASLAAHTGAPVLWADRDGLPAPTREAIRSRKDARIYVLGPRSAISDGVLADLKKLGDARRIDAPDPVRLSIAVARFADRGFGWNVVDPGHGLVFASTERAADAAAAAALASAGTHGPLLLLTDVNTLPAPLESYLLDIQPGYERDPVRGVYNHGWLLGDEDAISIRVQARIDALLEIQPVESPAVPSS